MCALAKMLLSVLLLQTAAGKFSYNLERNISEVAIALAEIINGLRPRQLAILARPLHKLYISDVSDDDDNAAYYIDDFIYRHIEMNLQGSIESVNLLFYKPYELSARIQERKLSHRLSLFIFYWGTKYPPKANQVRFEEPIRAVVITRPRNKAIYYNQAVPTGESNLKLVNWYDGDNLGLQKVPLLSSAAAVYSNFQGRVFRVPVFHSPPWFWVSYNNDTTVRDYDGNTLMDYNDANVLDMMLYKDINVTGGRDHRLLMLLAEHMNFQFVYIEAPGRTQGSLHAVNEANETFTGGIGMLQNGLADFFLGDVSLSWERRKAIEFSFFTLADSGAFATHAPRRLNEALAIIRPFQLDIWPYLILTIFFTGPIFYAIIAMPYKWRGNAAGMPCQRCDIEKLGDLSVHMVYIKEITMHNEATRRLVELQNQQFSDILHYDVQSTRMPKNLFERCVWYTVQLFLKQSCQELYHGYRAKFLMIVYWIAATYVLADVYAAQLTSQFARPAHEQPINTLQRLQTVMHKEGYKLYVEKESTSLEMLENGTEIFRQLYAHMKQQSNNDATGFLIDSVESGLKLIADGLQNKAVLGGRETLYFNIQQYGAKSFQLSQKLYTRYSAVAVQIGCPFLDSLNDVLMHLFESGILDKMTTAEYEMQSRMISKELSVQQQQQDKHAEIVITDDKNKNNNNNNEGGNGKGAESAQTTEQQDAQVIQALNLRMLQGAFIVLCTGYLTAVFVFVLEQFYQRLKCAICQCRPQLCWQRLWQFMRHGAVRILRS